MQALSPNPVLGAPDVVIDLGTGLLNHDTSHASLSIRIFHPGALVTHVDLGDVASAGHHLSITTDR